jgi:hypothetical protein
MLRIYLNLLNSKLGVCFCFFDVQVNTSSGIKDGLILIPGVKLPTLGEQFQEEVPNLSKEKKIIPTIELSTCPPSLQFEKNHILSFTYPSNFNSVSFNSFKSDCSMQSSNWRIKIQIFRNIN